MTTVAQRQQARLKGSSKAVQRWMQLDLDAEIAVDIFSVVEAERVWLLFEPLDNLYGFFERTDAAAGIVVHSKHPLAVQRFTAAHEYGHYVLGHQQSHDTRKELFASTPDVALQEIEAQAFAAEFMMPLAVVNRALDRLDLPRKPHELSALAAYQLSLELGCSYTATLIQLRQLNKLTDADVDRLGKREPIEIKAELGGGTKPANSWADAWLVNERTRGRHLSLRTGDELHVRLPELPSTGYRWASDWVTLNSALELIEDALEPGDLELGHLIGAERRRHLWWRATAAGEGSVALALRRPRADSARPPLEMLDLPLSIVQPRSGSSSGAGMSRRQRAPYVRALAA